MNSITLEQFSDHNLQEHIAVGKTVYETPEVLNVDHLRWKHLLGPWGPSISVSLRDGNRNLIGRSFIQPRSFITASGERTRGATVTDLIIAPGSRSASALIAMTRAIKAPEGFTLIAHTSNDTSDVIYRGLFKFPVAFNLTATGLPLRVSGALNTLAIRNGMAKGTLEALAAPWRWLVSCTAKGLSKITGLAFGPRPSEDELASIGHEFSSRVGQHFARDEAFLRWRFEDGPIFRGDLKWLWHKDECIGFVALKKVAIRDMEILVILDTVFRRSLSNRDGYAVRFLLAELAVNTKCDAIFSLSNLNNSELSWLGRFPYFRIPDKHLPHSTPIFIHTSGTIGNSQPLGDVFFTLADLDYF